MADPTDLTTYPVPSKSFIPGARNAEDFDKLLNGGNVTVTNRSGVLLGSYEKSISDARLAYGGLTNRGLWVTATAYTANDLWQSNIDSTWYLVLTTYTSNATEQLDIDSNNVAVYAQDSSSFAYKFSTVATMKTTTTIGGYLAPIKESQILETINYDDVNVGGGCRYRVESGVEDGVITHDLGDGFIAVPIVKNNQLSVDCCNGLNDLHPCLQSILDGGYVATLTNKQDYLMSQPFKPPQRSTIIGAGLWATGIQTPAGFIISEAGLGDDTYRLSRQNWEGFNVTPQTPITDSDYGIRFETEEMSYNKFRDFGIFGFKYDLDIRSRGWLNTFDHCRIDNLTGVTAAHLIRLRAHPVAFTGDLTDTGKFFSWDFISCTIAGTNVEKGFVAEDLDVDLQAINFIGGDFECDGYQTYVKCGAGKQIHIGFDNIDNDASSAFLITNEEATGKSHVSVTGGNYNCAEVLADVRFDYKHWFSGSTFAILGANYNGEPNTRYINGMSNEINTSVLGCSFDNDDKVEDSGYLDGGYFRIQKSRDSEISLTVVDTAVTLATIFANKDSLAGADEASTTLTVRVYGKLDAATFREETFPVLTEGVTSTKLTTLLDSSNREGANITFSIVSFTGGFFLRAEGSTANSLIDYVASVKLGIDGTYRF